MEKNKHSLVLLGDYKVGKTSLYFKLIEDKRLDGVSIEDTNGLERYNSLPSTYYRNKDIVILMYDLSNTKSFENLPIWFKKIESNFKKLIIIANKEDKLFASNIKFLDQEIYKYNAYFTYSRKNNEKYEILIAKILEFSRIIEELSISNYPRESFLLSKPRRRAVKNFHYHICGGECGIPSNFDYEYF